MGSLPGVGSFEILVVSVAGLLLLGKHLPQCVRNLKHLILDIRDGLFRW
jgi:Sec-independent protein translocase protein TatA